MKAPLEIKPEYDEEAQEITFCFPELNVIATAPTREEAIQQLQDDIIWLWQEYGESPPESLSLDALDLKSFLQGIVSTMHPPLRGLRFAHCVGRGRW